MLEFMFIEGEVVAMFEAIKQLSQMGPHNVIFESDSQSLRKFFLIKSVLYEFSVLVSELEICCLYIPTLRLSIHKVLIVRDIVHKKHKFYVATCNSSKL